MNETNQVNAAEVEDTSADTSQELFNLIQSIQSKLSDDQPKEEVQTDTKIEEQVKQTLDSSQSTNETNGGGFDLGAISSLLKNVDIGSVLNMFGGNSSNKSNTTTNSTEGTGGFDLGGIDAKTIMKFQRILGSMNKSDPKKNLLLSLKPFMRQSRQDKMSEYITMLTIANALDLFGSKGSDEDV